MLAQALCIHRVQGSQKAQRACLTAGRGLPTLYDHGDHEEPRRVECLAWKLRVRMIRAHLGLVCETGRVVRDCQVSASYGSYILLGEYLRQNKIDPHLRDYALGEACFISRARWRM